MSELGSGPSLDEQWDLYVDESSGDIAISNGSEELRKDLAFNVAIFLQDFVGDYISDGKRSDIRIGVRNIVLSDSRIDQVNSVRVGRSREESDELAVDVKATTVDGVTIEDVFTAA